MQYFLCNCNILRSQTCSEMAWWRVYQTILSPFKLKLKTNIQPSKIIKKSRQKSHAILYNNLQCLSPCDLFHRFLPHFPANIQDTTVALIQHEKKKTCEILELQRISYYLCQNYKAALKGLRSVGLI